MLVVIDIKVAANMKRKKRDRRTNNDLQNIKWKKPNTKTWGELRCSGKVRSSCSTCGTRHFTLVTNPVVCYE